MDRIKFTTDLFLVGAPRAEKIRECLAMATEAERLAEDANAHRREAYLDLARPWRELASDMERAERE